MENKASLYRTMVAYLTDLGADLAGHDQVPLIRTGSSTLGEMSRGDLLHYQRVLEATIDNPSTLMDKEAMRAELTEVVRERFSRGGVANKLREAREFRARIARLEDPRYTKVVTAFGSFDALLDHNGHIYESDSRDATALCGHDWGATYTEGPMESRYAPSNGLLVEGFDDPRGTLAKVHRVASNNGITLCPDCAREAENWS